MNKRQRKKQFKKLYGMNPKQYQQAMQLVSLEEPLEKFMDSETATFTDLGSCFERIKDGLQKISFCFGKIELRIVLFLGRAN